MPPLTLHLARPWRPFALLVAGVAAFQLVTLPRFSYPGDNLVARAETIQLLRSGQLGFPMEVKAAPEFEGLTDERGQYFFENDEKGLLYSKYGFGYTLLFILPTALASWLWGPVQPIAESEPLRLVVNVFNVLFAVGIAAYLFRVVSRFTSRRSLRVAFVLAALYSGYVWHYLRAPTLEVYQLFFFAALTSHLLEWVRKGPEDGPSGRVVRELAAASFAAGFLLLLRPTFALLLPLVAGIALFAGRGRPQSRSWAPWVAALAPIAALCAVWLVVNWVRTGSALNSGYGQWVGADGLPVAHVTLASLVPALKGFLLELGNYNVLLHQPLLLVALLGWPAFVRRHRIEALAILALALICILPILLVSNWQAEWCYGPRYLIHPLLLLCLPAVTFAEDALRWRPSVQGAVAGACGVVLGLSFLLQVQMNSLHYFVFQFSDPGDLVQDERIREWYRLPRVRSVYAWELKGFVEQGRPLPPFELALERVPEPARAEARTLLRRNLSALVEPNWYFSAAAEER